MTSITLADLNIHTMPEHSSRRTISQLADLSQYEKTLDCYIDVTNDEGRVVAITADKNEHYKPTSITAKVEISG